MKKVIFGTSLSLLLMVSFALASKLDNRYERIEEKVRILSDGSMEIHSFYRIKVANREGQDLGVFVASDEKGVMKVKKMKARILDAQGKVLTKSRKKDLRKIAASPGYALYSNNLFSILEMRSQKFPYFLEYEEDIRLSSTFLWPDIIFRRNFPIREYHYELSLPAGYDFSFHGGDSLPQPIIEKEGRVYSWTMTNIAPWPDERRSDPRMSEAYTLIFAPEKFRYVGYEGSIQSWKDYAAWYEGIISSKFDLSPKDLVIKNPESLSKKEIIAQLLEYIQKNMRYVLIDNNNFGIIPNPASKILASGYGDCKDLDLFFINQCRLAGIEAWPVLVKTRVEGLVDTTIVASQFNHFISWADLGDTTMFVDCTAPLGSINNLPEMDEEGMGLLVCGPNSKIVRLPGSRADQNRFSLTGTGKIDVEGNTQLQRENAVDG